MIERRGPEHDLKRMQELVLTYTFGGGVLAKAQKFVSAPSRLETIPIVRALIRSLTPEDFLQCHGETYGWVDDYAKIDEFGLWFAKLGIKTDGSLLVCSCHESDKDEVRLHNGTILRRPTE